MAFQFFVELIRWKHVVRTLYEHNKANVRPLRRNIAEVAWEQNQNKYLNVGNSSHGHLKYFDFETLKKISECMAFIFICALQVRLPFFNCTKIAHSKSFTHKELFISALTGYSETYLESNSRFPFALNRSSARPSRNSDTFEMSLTRTFHRKDITHSKLKL